MMSTATIPRRWPHLDADARRGLALAVSGTAAIASVAFLMMFCTAWAISRRSKRAPRLFRAKLGKVDVRMADAHQEHDLLDRAGPTSSTSASVGLGMRAKEENSSTMLLDVLDLPHDRVGALVENARPR
jgi:hypothetical protein